MKKYIGKIVTGIISAIFGFIAVGCSTLGNGEIDIPLVDSPYQAGRTFVFIDTITEPFQPAELALAIDQVYALANANFETESFVDAIVQAQIDEMYADSTDESRAMIFAMYKAVFARIEFQVESNPELPEIEVIDQFFNGVRDALAVYQPTEEE